MAIKLNGADDEDAELHEINVTPFIDVMLVLLIIFMVAAPLATVDVPVQLPTASGAGAARPDKPIFLTLKADHSLSLGEAMVMTPALGAALDRLTNHDREQRVFLRADTVVPYGEVMRVMNALRSGGYLKVALVGLDSGASTP